MKPKSFVLVVLIVCTLVAARPASGKEKPERIPVYVTSVGAVKGMTDPNKNNQDTVNDLRGGIASQKQLKLVYDRNEALIVLVVLDRAQSQMTAGLFSTFARDVAVRVKFIVKDIETELTASAQGGAVGTSGAWSRAAIKIAKQVDYWVTHNRDKLK
jgi:hypothetical protein